MILLDPEVGDLLILSKDCEDLLPRTALVIEAVVYHTGSVQAMLMGNPELFCTGGVRIGIHSGNIAYADKFIKAKDITPIMRLLYDI